MMLCTVPEEISVSTRVSYQRKNDAFRIWLREKYPDQIVDNQIRIPLTNDDAFLKYLTMKTYKHGDPQNGQNTFGTIQLEISAFKFLYHQKNHKISNFLDQEIVKFIKGIMVSNSQCAQTLPSLFYVSGYKKDVAQKKQTGEMKSDEGKRPFSMALLVHLANLLIHKHRDPNNDRGTRDYKSHVFAHLFMLLSWAIGCRSNSTADIHLSSIDWVADALVITLEKSKGALD